LARDPPNWLANAAIDKRLGIFRGKAPRPFFESLLGEFAAIGVGVLQRSMKLGTTATIEFVADGFSDEFAAVLLPPVNVPDEVIG
jgi:hypothetical protein